MPKNEGMCGDTTTKWGRAHSLDLGRVKKNDWRQILIDKSAVSAVAGRTGWSVRIHPSTSTSRTQITPLLHTRVLEYIVLPDALGRAYCTISGNHA